MRAWRIVGLAGVMAVAIPAGAQDDLDLDQVRREIQQNSSKGVTVAGFSPVGEELVETSRRLEAAEAKLLDELRARDAHKQPPPARDDGFGPNPAAPAVEPARAVKSAAAAIPTRDEGAALPRFNEEVPVTAAEVHASAVIEEVPAVPVKQVARRSTEHQHRLREAALVDPKTAAREEKSFGELRELIEKHTTLRNELKAQTATATSLKKKNSQLSEDLSSADRRIKNLENELSEARNRLMMAETEVERLSGLVQTGSRSTTLARVEELAAQRRAPAAAPAVQRITSAIPAEEMPIATIVVDKANLRTGPGQDNSPLMSVSRGTRLAVETRRGDWYRVISPTGARAWVSAEVIAFGSTPVSSPSRTVRVRAYDASLEN